MGNHVVKPSRERKPSHALLDKLHKSVPNMDLDEIRSQWEIFHLHSKGRHGLTKKNFIKVYTLIFGKEASEFAELIFKAFDSNGDGKVTFEEFLIGLSLTDGSFGGKDEQRRKKLEFFFGVYDRDKSGTIDREEMRGIVKAIFKLVMTPEEQIDRTPEEFADELFQAADVDNDGSITFEEFERAVTLDHTLLNILLPSPQDDDDSDDSGNTGTHL